MAKAFFMAGCVFALLTVGLGAFGAHGLKSRISADMLAVFQTGVQYQFYHAIALLILALLVRQLGISPLFQVSGYLFIAGIVLFSGSLFVLSLTGIKQLGMVTPIGGLCFLAGWLTMLIGGIKMF